MDILSVRDYRNNLAASFDKVDRGENVLIRRKNQYYALVRVGKEDLTISNELRKRIDEVNSAYRDGKCVTCSTADELNSFLDSL